ncbi:MAG: hypothetical protein R3D65_00335 [Zhengella sp.]|uniref:hypothetical protein n=1 Tax=Zhengella sp. TaxID=2282762 RepID=UPI00352905A1
MGSRRIGIVEFNTGDSIKSWTPPLPIRCQRHCRCWTDGAAQHTGVTTSRPLAAAGVRPSPGTRRRRAGIAVFPVWTATTRRPPTRPICRRGAALLAAGIDIRAFGVGQNGAAAARLVDDGLSNNSRTIVLDPSWAGRPHRLTPASIRPTLPASSFWSMAPSSPRFAGAIDRHALRPALAIR